MLCLRLSFFCSDKTVSSTNSIHPMSLMGVDWQPMDVDPEAASFGHQEGAGPELKEEAVQEHTPPEAVPVPDDEPDGQDSWRDFCCSCLDQVHNDFLHYFGSHQLCNTCWKYEWKDFFKSDDNLKQWMTPAEYQGAKQSFKEGVCKYLDYKCAYCHPCDASDGDGD